MAFEEVCKVDMQKATGILSVRLVSFLVSVQIGETKQHVPISTAVDERLVDQLPAFSRLEACMMTTTGRCTCASTRQNLPRIVHPAAHWCA